MAWTTAAKTAFLKLLFENVSWANIGDATGLVKSTADGVFYVGLAVGDPGVAGTQLTSECAYTSYARVSVARGIAKWTVTGDTVVTDALVTFPISTGGSETATHLTLGTDSTGAGNLLNSVALDSSLLIVSGVQPEFPIGNLSGTAT